MKKFLLIAVLLALPLVTSASTMDASVLASLLKQLQALQQMVLVLQAQLNSLVSGGSTFNTTTFPGSTNNIGSFSSGTIGLGYQTGNSGAVLGTPQQNNGLNGVAGGQYGGVQLASLGTRTSAPALGAYAQGCSLSPGWTIPLITSQYGSQFAQTACGHLSKQLFLFSIDYCTNATDCYHHDYTGQYKIPRETLEKALGFKVSTFNFDPVSVDPFNTALHSDRGLNAKCMAVRQHGNQYDLYEAGCGTHTGLEPIQQPEPVSTGMWQTGTTATTQHYGIDQIKSMGTRTSVAPLGSAGGYCSLSTYGEASNWGKDGTFINASCRMYGLGYRSWLYSIRYKYDNKCYLHDYTGQYEVSCDVLGNPPVISAIPTIYDGMTREYFNSGFQAQCWALRNHGGQLGGYDAGCGTTTGY